MRSCLLLLAACGGSETPAIDAPGAGDAQPDGGGLVSLDKTPTTYRGTCDGSGALALSFTHFLDLNDEKPGRAHLRTREAGGARADARHQHGAWPRRERRGGSRGRHADR